MLRFYWDSCTFISRIQGDPDRIAQLEYITDEAAERRMQIVTSTLAVAEVCYIRRKCSPEELKRDVTEIARFFDNDYIHLVQVSRRIATEAAQIARLYNVKPADAIHLATAIESGCQEVHTYDGSKLLKLDGKVGTPPLTISEPNFSIQGELFEDADDGE
jgi:predicted nucleic acid-binding protein